MIATLLPSFDGDSFVHLLTAVADLRFRLIRVGLSARDLQDQPRLDALNRYSAALRQSHAVQVVPYPLNDEAAVYTYSRIILFLDEVIFRSFYFNPSDGVYPQAVLRMSRHLPGYVATGQLVVLRDRYCAIMLMLGHTGGDDHDIASHIVIADSHRLNEHMSCIMTTLQNAHGRPTLIIEQEIREGDCRARLEEKLNRC